MYLLTEKCRKHDLPVDLQLELFNVMVISVLTYACEIWGCIVARELNQLHMNFFKTCFVCTQKC